MISLFLESITELLVDPKLYPQVNVKLLRKKGCLPDPQQFILIVFRISPRNHMNNHWFGNYKQIIQLAYPTKIGSKQQRVRPHDRFWGGMLGVLGKLSG